VLAGLARVAVERGYTKPEIVDEPVLDIRDGRHPVLEQVLGSEFVPNDVALGGEHPHVGIITGPNMAGKSTYIRQAALLALMAHMGSWLPARHAVVGLADRIFTRVGASDELARGRSTFMVEMSETANILNNATARSLVILDEVGRGTSTFDGVALAWAATEHIARTLGCRTLFATHYHELTELADTLAGVANFNVAVREWQDQVVFLHKILPGGTDKSYGVHVARLAGVPRDVVERARSILADLEAAHLDPSGRPKLAGALPKTHVREVQLTLFEGAGAAVADALRALDPDRMTPLEALAKLKELREGL
jgi:DNA mismatch repair protein MutS